MNKIHTGILAAALLAAASVAQATSKPDNSGTVNQGGTGNGYGGQGGSAVAGASAGAVGVGVGLGGAGGSGGAGGAGGNGGMGGAGGSVAGSGNSANSNVNTAKGGNAQQGQAQSSRNDNKSSAAGNTTAVNVSGDAITYEAARIPVATAYAPNIAPTALCALGVSAGGQGMSFGFSFGTSYIDANCQQLEQVRTAAAVLGDRETAAEMMCGMSEAYREARIVSGKPCGQRAKLGAASDMGVTTVTAKVEYTDPIVRARLGLPPLK